MTRGIPRQTLIFGSTRSLGRRIFAPQPGALRGGPGSVLAPTGRGGGRGTLPASATRHWASLRVRLSFSPISASAAPSFVGVVPAAARLLSPPQDPFSRGVRPPFLRHAQPPRRATLGSHLPLSLRIQDLSRVAGEVSPEDRSFSGRVGARPRPVRVGSFRVARRLKPTTDVSIFF